MRKKIQKIKNPKMRNNKDYFNFFGKTITAILLTVFTFSCTKEIAKDASVGSATQTLSIAKTFPANQADTVAINPVVAVTFNSTTSAADVSASTLVLKEGTIAVAGTVTTTGSTMNFTPSADLKPNTTYTATITTSKKGSKSDDSAEHSWTFTTGKDRQNNAFSIVSFFPANNATEVTLDVKPTITFNLDLTINRTKSLKISLMQGNALIEGTVTYSGKTGTFTPSANLIANKVYTVKVVSSKSNDENDHESTTMKTWNFTTTGSGTDVTPPTILSSVPANNAIGVLISTHPTITFSEAMTASTINTATFNLNQGTVAISGTVTYSGTTATFTPASNLMPNTVYTGTITNSAKDAAGNALAGNYTWSFTTASAADVIPPTVLSVVPANSATSVVSNIHPTVTFSEAMTASTINTTTFTLKQGSTNIAGTVAYSGTSATFTPSGNLLANTVYSGTITTGAKDAAGNALAGNYTWSFTTAAAADVTAPTVVSIVPASNATSIVVNSNISVTFSEAMNSSTITSATFTLKQGSTAVAGSVTYSGTTATFNPTSDLAGGTVYTATITTGTTDVAGNAIASNYSWNFTTAATVTLVSFSTQVFPIVQSKCMPCHSGASPSAGISLTNYTQVKAIGTRLDNPGMYTKMGVTVAEQTMIKTWLAQGSLNN